MTAVEWLVQELNLYSYISQINQAKELEKQQIIDACYFGSQDLPYEIKEKSEQYYKETFKK